VDICYCSQYRVDKSSHSFSPGRFSAKVQSPSGSSPLNLAVSFYGSGSVRVKLSEDVPRWQVVLLCYAFIIVTPDITSSYSNAAWGHSDG